MIYTAHDGDQVALTIAHNGRNDATRATAILTGDETGKLSDGRHTFDELYRIRALYHAAFVNAWTHHVPDGLEGPRTVKSWKHSDGELCFGGGWFIVVTHLWDGEDGKPSGQISNHYPATDWDLFQVPEVELPPTYDGHTTEEAAERLEDYLRHG